MRQRLTSYEEELDLISALQRQIKRALQLMAWDIRNGTSDERLLSKAIFGNLTKFGLEEAALYAFHNSMVSSTQGVVNLSIRQYEATDAQIKRCIEDIKNTLIALQNDANRTVVGLGL